MAAKTTSCARRVGSRAGGLVLLAAALALGCKGTIQSSSDAGSVLHAGCGGTIDITGHSPEGPFTATSVYADVANYFSICPPDLQFIVGDSVAGSAFVFDLPVVAVDGGASVPLGETSATVSFSGRHIMGTALFQAATTAAIDVTAAEPPPLATCAQAGGNAIDLGTGNISMSLLMLEDGFDIAGTLSTPYCTCRLCPDVN